MAPFFESSPGGEQLGFMALNGFLLTKAHEAIKALDRPCAVEDLDRFLDEIERRAKDAYNSRSVYEIMSFAALWSFVGACDDAGIDHDHCLKLVEQSASNSFRLAHVDIYGHALPHEVTSENHSIALYGQVPVLVRRISFHLRGILQGQGVRLHSLFNFISR